MATSRTQRACMDCRCAVHSPFDGRVTHMLRFFAFARLRPISRFRYTYLSSIRRRTEPEAAGPSTVPQRAQHGIRQLGGATGIGTSRPNPGCADRPSTVYTIDAGLRRPRLRHGSMQPRARHARLVRLRISNNKQPVSVTSRYPLLQGHSHTRWLAAVLRLSSNRLTSACMTGSSLARSLGSSRSNILVFFSSPATHHLRTPLLDTIEEDQALVTFLRIFPTGGFAARLPLMQPAEASDYPSITGLATRLKASSVHAHARGSMRHPVMVGTCDRGRQTDAEDRSNR